MPHKLNLNVVDKTTIRDLITTTVNIFNEKFIESGIIYRLNTTFEDYNLKPSKKSGKPNSDLPCKII